MSADPDHYKLSDEDHERIFRERIVPTLFSGAKPAQGRPVAVVWGGQPGSGKSPALEASARELDARGGAVQVIGDDLRAWHPKYAELLARDDKTAAFYTDRDSGRWVEKAIEHAKANRYHLVIEGTMRSPDTVARTLTGLRDAGYETHARALAVAERVSWQGVVERYEAQRADRGSGRMTAPHSHTAAYEGVPATLERIERDRLADRVVVQRRGADVIYDNRLAGDSWAHPPQARAVLEAERARTPTVEERREYAARWDRIHARVTSPERAATPAELAAVESQRRQAHAEHAAAAFRELPAVEATRQRPELAGAFAALQAIDRQAEAHGMTPAQRAVIERQARERIAGAIEKGEAPSIAVRQELQREHRERPLER